MSNPWPKRNSSFEPDSEYLIRMVQQLFVEIAQVKAMLEHPLYQINVPPASTEIMEAMKCDRQEDMGFR